MPTYNNINYLTLPQQVEKNRYDILTEIQNRIDGLIIEATAREKKDNELAQSILDLVIGDITNFSGIIRGNSTKYYMVFSGVMYNADGVWTLYGDSVHSSINVGEITSTSTKVTINTLLTGKIVSFQIDNSVLGTQIGLNVGASVNSQQVDVFFNKDPQIINGHVAYNGSAWVVDAQYGDGEIDVVSYTSGVLTLSHVAMDTNIVFVTSLSAMFTCSATAVSPTQTTVKFIKIEDGVLATDAHFNMSFYVQRNSQRKVNVDPSTITNAVWFQGIVELPE